MARRGLGSDPLRSFRFMVTIKPHIAFPGSGSIGKLAFQTVSGLGFTNNEVDYREGGDNTTTRKMPGMTDFSDVSLAHGVGAIPELGGTAYTGQELYDWSRMIFSAVAGGGNNPGTSGHRDFRAEVAIDLLAHPITSGVSYAGMPRGQGTWPIKKRWVLTNVWPGGMTWGDFDATANSIAIETLVLKHEGFEIYTAPSGGYLKNTTGMGSTASGGNPSTSLSNAQLTSLGAG